MANGTASQGSAPDVGQCLAIGLERFKPQMGLLVATTLVAALVIGVGNILPKIGSLISIAVAGPMSLGLIRCYRDAYRGQNVNFERLFSGFQEFVPALLNNLVATIAIGIGFVLLIVPGLVILGLLAYWPLVLDDGKNQGIEAVMGSKDLTQPFLVQAVITTVVLCLIGGLGAIVLGIGVLFTGPIAGIGLIHAYETMRGSQAPQS